MHPADILVIDDSPTVRRMVELVLTREGHHVRCAVDGAVGLDLARESRPDLILVDYMMPTMNGLEFCVRIRSDEKLNSVPIILISSKGEAVGAVFEERFGVVESLTKPFEPDELVKKIQAVLPAEAAVPEAETVQAADSVEEGSDLTIALERFDRMIRSHLDARLPSMLKTIFADSLREQGVVAPGSMSMNGSVRDFPLPDLLNLLASTRVTGRLSIITKLAFCEIFVEDGLFVFASTSQKTGRHRFLTDVISESLNIRLDPAVILEVIAESQEAGRPVGGLLVERGLIDKAELNSALREHAQHALNTSLEITDGEFTFDREALPANLADIDFRLPMPHVLMDGIRLLDEKHLDASRLPDNDVVLTRYISNEAAEEITLGAKEMSAFMAIDGRKTLGRLIKELGCPDLEFKRICALLMSTGMVRVAQKERRASDRAAANLKSNA
ncbi:MAG: response regulator [Myxococcota bacterium]